MIFLIAQKSNWKTYAHKLSYMNRLSTEKRTQILRLLVEGNSLRSSSRIANVDVNTVMKLLVSAGKVCQQFHDDTVIGLTPEKLELDEVVTFVYAKEYNLTFHKRQNKKGKDAWTWIAIDSDTKLVVSWFVGDRDTGGGNCFFDDLIKRINLNKLKKKVLICTDGFLPYVGLIRNHFGRAHSEFAQLMKYYGKKNPKPADGDTAAYGRFVKTEKFIKWGNVDPKQVSTSFIERQNLTLRMCNRRYTRRTNAFSKKWENHLHSLALHFVYYNFIRPHKTLRVTPAMAAKLTKRFMKLEDVVKLIELDEEQEKKIITG